MDSYLLATINSSVGNVSYNINNIYLVSANNFRVDLTIFGCRFPYRKTIFIK
jgi:subtilase family serine protease